MLATIKAVTLVKECFVAWEEMADIKEIFSLDRAALDVQGWAKLTTVVS